MGSGGPHHWAKGTASGTAAAVAGADAAAAAAGTAVDGQGLVPLAGVGPAFPRSAAA